MDSIAPYPKANFTNAREWHIYYVYNDSGFRKLAIPLIKKYSFPDFNPESMKSSLEFIGEVNKASQDKAWIQLKNDFYLGDYDLVYFIQGAHNQGFFNNAKLDENMGVAYLEERENAIKLHLASHVTHEGYMRLWKDVLRLKKQITKPTKRKSLEHPGLIYDIFKARQSKLTFSTIFELYKNGELPNHTGSIKQFGTKEDLKRYYNSHKPTSR